MTDNIERKICPFCHQKDEYIDGNRTLYHDGNGVIVCDSCGAQGPDGQGSKIKGVELWNARPSEVVEAGVDEKIPMGAIENGREFFRRLEQHYSFLDDENHHLINCYEYEQVKACFETLVTALTQPSPPITDEKRKAALERLTKFITDFKKGDKDAYGLIACTGNEHTCDLWVEDIEAALTQPDKCRPYDRLTIRVLLDALATAAKGETLDPEECQTIESIAVEYDHTDYTPEDIQALYDCGYKQRQGEKS